MFGTRIAIGSMIGPKNPHVLTSDEEPRARIVFQRCGTVIVEAESQNIWTN